MDDYIKRKMILRYFVKRFPWWTIWVVLFGIVVFLISTQVHLSLPLVGVGGVGVMQGVGIVIFNIGFLGIFAYAARRRPTDGQMDTWLEQDKDMFAGRALDRLGTLEEQLIKDPLVTFKPIFWSIRSIDPSEVLSRKGRDGLTRFSIWDGVVFHFTDKYLGCFHATLNLLTGRTTDETTDEFFYQDIVRVGTSQESVLLKDGRKITDAESFVLKVSSGDAVMVRDITFRLEQKGTRVVPTTPIQKSIQAIRTMLREKKR